MKAPLLLFACAAGGLMFWTQANAQTLLQITFKGTSQSTNTSGRITSQTVNNQSLVKDCLNESGSNPPPGVLVYSVNGDERGDVIEVVNGTNGAVICPVFGLFFPQTIDSGDVSQVQQFAFVFNDQQAESIGAALLSEKYPAKDIGNTNRLNIRGTMQYFLLPEGSNGLRICNASFTAAKLFVTNTPAITSTNSPGSTNNPSGRGG